jgi:hypothetical protein
MYHGMEKPSMGYVFRMLNFHLSLVLYLSQVYLQHLSKIPDSWSSCCLCLCPSHHFLIMFILCTTSIVPSKEEVYMNILGRREQIEGRCASLAIPNPLAMGPGD